MLTAPGQPKRSLPFGNSKCLACRSPRKREHPLHLFCAAPHFFCNSGGFFLLEEVKTNPFDPNGEHLEAKGHDYFRYLLGQGRNSWLGDAIRVKADSVLARAAELVAGRLVGRVSGGRNRCGMAGSV